MIRSSDFDICLEAIRRIGDSSRVMVDFLPHQTPDFEYIVLYEQGKVQICLLAKIESIDFMEKFIKSNL